jgi:hypothetical protein
LQAVPTGWIIDVSNHSNGDCEIEGSIDVGAAAEDVTFIRRSLRITTSRNTREVEVKGEIELMDHQSPTNTVLKFRKADVLFESVN